MLDNKKVERFIAACMKYEGDLYSQPKRMVPGFSDCSSIPYKALKAIGLLDESQTTRTISTKFMRDGDPRMYQISMGQIQRGDLLWWQKPGTTDSNYYGHTGVYLGGGKVLEAIKPRAKITSIKRLAWQRAYRIKALDSNSTVVSKKVIKETTEFVSYISDGVVTDNKLNIRIKPQGAVIGQFNKNDKVKITGKQGDWYRIIYKARDAFISSKYVSDVKMVDIYVNGEKIKKGTLKDGTTFISINGENVPVRTLFESIGAKVEWKDEKVQIII